MKVYHLFNDSHLEENIWLNTKVIIILMFHETIIDLLLGGMFRKKLQLHLLILEPDCNKSPVRLLGAIENSLGQSEVQSVLPKWTIKI